MLVVRKIKNTAHLMLAATAAFYHGFPGKKMIIIGVTGTDGKTTTSNLIYHILQTAGKRTAVISTIGAVIDGTVYETGFHVTTPSSFAIQKYLKIAKKKGCTHVILEVTSHAIDQYRIWGIHFKIGVLTNITREHLDYHKNYQNYVNAKLKLFKYADEAVINSNGEWFEDVLKIIPKKKLTSYSLHGKYPSDLSILTMPFKIKTKLIGDFNLENIIAATVTAQILGISPSLIDKAIQTFKPPIGRQEEVGVKDHARVIIDFAHTANAFEKMLSEVRKKTTGRLIHVFGAAGERDNSKRSEMGKVAAYYDDIIILTAEDPRSEKVSQINSQIKKGIQENKIIHEIENRRDAVLYALSIATSNDTVIITGKGHERSMNYGNGEEKWSDQEIVEEFYKKK